SRRARGRRRFCRGRRPRGRAPDDTRGRSDPTLPVRRPHIGVQARDPPRGTRPLTPSLPGLSVVEGPGLSAVEGPALGEVEGPALSAVEGPALIAVEGPALSEVEGPALIAVEGPALSEVEGPGSILPQPLPPYRYTCGHRRCDGEPHPLADVRQAPAGQASQGARFRLAARRQDLPVSGGLRAGVGAGPRVAEHVSPLEVRAVGG